MLCLLEEMIIKYNDYKYNMLVEDRERHICMKVENQPQI